MPIMLDDDGNEIPTSIDESRNESGEVLGDARILIPPEVVPEQPGASWVDALFPRASRAVNEGRGAGTASAWDAYSLPWRALSAGVQTGAQALGAAMTGSPNDQETFREAMARTGGSSQDPRFVQAIDQIVRAPENTVFAPAAALRGAAAIPAWMARAVPAWGRGAVAGVELGAAAGDRASRLGRGVVRAIPATSAVVASSQGERIASGESVSPLEAGAMLGAGLGLGALGPMMEKGGAQLKRGAREHMRQIIKPTRDEVDGFYKAIDAGLLPQMAGPFTLTAGGAGDRYMGRLEKMREQVYKPAVAAADATGAKVNMDRVAKEATDYLRGEMDSRRLALGEESFEPTVDWMRGKVRYLDQAGREALQEANIPYQGRYVPLIGKEDVYATVRGEPIMETGRFGTGGSQATTQRVPILDEKGRFVLGADLMPKYETVIGIDRGPSVGKSYGQSFDKSLSPRYTEEQKLIGQKDVISGFQKLPDYYEPIPDVELPVGAAHRLKSGLQDIAFSGGEPAVTAPRAGTKAVAKGAEKAIRKQIGEVSPEYARADAIAAPWYAGADAMGRAQEFRGNNKFLGLTDVLTALGLGGVGSTAGVGTGLGGLALGIAASKYANSPAGARLMWEGGRGLGALARNIPTRAAVAGPVLLKPATDNARGH